MISETPPSWFQRTKTVTLNTIGILSGVSILIGGGIQYYFLSSLGPGYLRFFSVTQLLSDSLTTLPAVTSLGIIFVSFFVGGFIQNTFKKNQPKTETKTAPNFTDWFLFGMTSFIVVVSLFMKTDGTYQDVLWAIGPGFFWWCATIQIVEKSFSIELIKKILFWASLIALFGFYSLFFVRALPNDIILPPNLQNSEYPCPTQYGPPVCDIHYFHDHYIFLRVPGDKVQIVPFDHLFLNTGQE